MWEKWGKRQMTQRPLTTTWRKDGELSWGQAVVFCRHSGCCEQEAHTFTGQHLQRSPQMTALQSLVPQKACATCRCVAPFPCLLVCSGFFPKCIKQLSWLEGIWLWGETRSEEDASWEGEFQWGGWPILFFRDWRAGVLSASCLITWQVNPRMVMGEIRWDRRAGKNPWLPSPGTGRIWDPASCSSMLPSFGSGWRWCEKSLGQQGWHWAGHGPSTCFSESGASCKVAKLDFPPLLPLYLLADCCWTQGCVPGKDNPHGSMLSAYSPAKLWGWEERDSKSQSLSVSCTDQPNSLGRRKVGELCEQSGRTKTEDRWAEDCLDCSSSCVFVLCGWGSQGDTWAPYGAIKCLIGENNPVHNWLIQASPVTHSALCILIRKGIKINNFLKFLLIFYQITCLSL